MHLDKKDANQASRNRAAAGIEAAMSSYFSTTDTQGRWLLSNLPDGTYTIDVRPTGILGSKLERFVDKRQDLTVAGADVENLAIEVSLGAAFPGTSPSKRECARAGHFDRDRVSDRPG